LADFSNGIEKTRYHTANKQRRKCINIGEHQNIWGDVFIIINCSYLNKRIKEKRIE
jgi:hypothetical protein